MATLGRQAVDLGHDLLPLAAVRADAAAEQLVGDQVRHLVGHGLAQEMLAVFPVQLGIEAQAVLAQVRDSGLEAAQAQADLGAREAPVEKGFGLLVAGLDAGHELFGHERAVPEVWRRLCPNWPAACAEQTTRPPAGGLK
ncbi:hypothetical protein D3C81_1255880 [compost metagenome]